MYRHELSITEGKELANTFPIKAGSKCGQPSPDGAFVCTQSCDHTTEHVAHILDGTVVAVWDDRGG